MRDPERIDAILGKIEHIWKFVPEWRFGQLLINLGLVKDTVGSWNTDDDIYETILDNWIEDHIHEVDG